MSNSHVEVDHQLSGCHSTNGDDIINGALRTVMQTRKHFVEPDHTSLGFTGK
jgi:hypothetical protein